MKNEVEHTAHITIDHTCDELFHLFTAEGGQKWVPDRNFEKVTKSKSIKEDYVFVTSDSGKNDARMVWLVKEYKPKQHSVTYYKVEPDKVALITLSCTPADEGGSRVTITYKYTALNEEGQEFVEAFTPERYKTFMVKWHELLQAYFLWVEEHPEEA